MDNSKNLIQKFYEQYYSKDQNENPALMIYDRLRINKIKSAIEKYYSTGRILIIGCGSKRDSEIFDLIEKTYAFDLSFNAIKRIKTQNKKLFVADATNLPFSKNQFDIIVMSEVIEHIPHVDKAVSEIFQTTNEKGKLILSTPNWISFFGLARWIAKIFFKKNISADDQPFDDWKTITKLKNELSPSFNLIHSSGIWYLPPLHYKNRGVSNIMMKIIYLIYYPFEKLFSFITPYFGHMLFTVFIVNK